jgi:hypothetical protein
MSFSFSTRCGSCIPTYGDDLCNTPTPQKYSNCHYTILSSLQISDPVNNPLCDPGYTDFCKSTNDAGTSTVMCCPNTSNQNNFIKFDCNDSTCDIKINYQNRKMECSSVNSLIDCLNSPDSTSVNGVEDDFPVPWLIPPSDIYKGFRTVTTPCGGLDDYSCLPYSNLFQTKDINETGSSCPSGKQTDYYFMQNSSCSSLQNNPLCTKLTWTATTDSKGAATGNHTYGVTNHTTLAYNPPLACPAGKKRRTECDTTTTYQPPIYKFFGFTITPRSIELVDSITCCDPYIDTVSNNCTTMANFSSGSAEKATYCQLVCPSIADQKKIFPDQNGKANENICDYSYYDLCKQAGCTPDPKCSDVGITARKWLPNKTGLLIPNRIPTVINKVNTHTHVPTSAPIS